ncbi:MAG TPA: hypothetical protein EYH34_05785, partial [Planctomycetes bacterium]|nr:hypothetical protein [Planctomycetota bacterium]
MAVRWLGTMVGPTVALLCGVGAVWAADDGAGPGPQAQSEAAEQEGPEVLMRGPIHEAFATQIDFGAKPGPVVPRKPPEPVEEVPPEVRPEGEEIVWIPGYWAWDEEREDFVWVSGVWRKAPPGRRWLPGYWEEADGGYRWISGAWVPAESDRITYRPPPRESLERGPTSPRPSDDHFWVPGCWIYYADCSCYRWRPGYWAPCQPGWVWVPAYYVWTPTGVIYVHGYWDYLLVRRGVLCPPVYFYRPIYLRPGYRLVHHVVIDTPRLLVHLFVHPRWRHYYFGDYYGPVYARRGFYPWFRFHAGHHGYDPLWPHYVWRNRRAGVDLPSRLERWHQYFAARPEARPPHTFQQLRAVGRARPGSPAASLARLGRPATELAARHPSRRLIRLSADQRDRVTAASRQYRAIAAKRSGVERGLGLPARAAGPNVAGQGASRSLTLPRLDRRAHLGSTVQGFGRQARRAPTSGLDSFGSHAPAAG